MTDLAKMTPPWELPLWAGLACWCLSPWTGSPDHVWHYGGDDNMQEGTCGDSPFHGSWLLCQFCCNLKPQLQPQENQYCPKRSGNGHPSTGKVAGQSAGSPCRRRKKGPYYCHCFYSGVAHAVGELDWWLRRPSINYLNKKTAEHCWCAAFHICCPNHFSCVLLPHLFAHQEVQGCCKSPKLLVFPLPFPSWRIQRLIPQLRYFYILPFKADIELLLLLAGL